MNELKISTQKILEELATRFPNVGSFRKSVIEETAKSLGYTGKDWVPLCSKENRVKRGTYDLSTLITPLADRTGRGSDRRSVTCIEPET